MGPSRHFFQKNRSQHSLLNPQEPNDKVSYLPSPIDSPLHSPGLPPTSAAAASPNDEVEEHQSYNTNLPHRSEEARYYQSGLPTRSQSQRLPSITTTTQPTIHLVGPKSSANTPIDDEPDRYYQQVANPHTFPVQKEDRKKRRFFGLGGAKEPPAPPSAKLGRSTSVRRKEPAPEAYPVQQQQQQQQWSSSRVSPTDDDEDEEGGAGLHPTQPGSVGASPIPPEKDPLRSPGFPPPITHQEYAYGRSAQQATTSSSSRHPLDRQGSHQSSSVQQYSHTESGQLQGTPTSYHPSPSSATSSSSPAFHQKAPSDKNHQYYREEQSRPPSQQSLDVPTPAPQPRGYDPHHARSSSSQASSSAYTQSSMGPPPPPGQQQPPSRRSSEAPPGPPLNQQGGQGREGAGYQPYNQGMQGGVVPSNAPPQYSQQLSPQTQRTNSQLSPMPQQGTNDQGRSTPPLNRSRDELSNLDVAQLLARHDELQDKYRKVKKYYFDKDGQVQQLQNTLAHQRLSQSRTSLDDNEYANRFCRLDGAINNLAFNIRRDWRQVPPWLAPHVNRDAATQPTKEMTAVGRAAISRWLIDEILDRYFHPGLDPTFSAQLKVIEKNLRRFAPPTTSDEEKDALLSKISNWRLTTLDGLQDLLSSPQAAENRATLTESLIERLTTSLSMMLKDPAPPGLEGGVTMIVELVVGIGANLPLESRDVFVNYVSPGQLVTEAYMKIETGLPALTNPGDGPVEGDAASLTSKQTEDTGSIDSRDTGGNGNGNGNGAEEGLPGGKEAPQPTKIAPETRKKSMFGGLIGGAGAKKVFVGSQGTPTQQGQGPKEDRVRFSTFMAVEVRGRSVLVKAPVYVSGG